MIEIVPASPAHVGTLANRLRDIDVLECKVMGHSPREALRLGLMSSSMAWTAKVNGRPEAMFGVSTTSLLELSGRPWMLMTPEGVKHGRALVRLGHRYTEAMQQHYSLLQNWVHARNDIAIRWLARLGYAIGPVDVIRGQPMRPFFRCAIRSQH